MINFGEDTNWVLAGNLGLYMTRDEVMIPCFGLKRVYGVGWLDEKVELHN